MIASILQAILPAVGKFVDLGSGIANCCDGEDASCDAVALFSEQSNTIEDTPLVA